MTTCFRKLYCSKCKGYTKHECYSIQYGKDEWGWQDTCMICKGITSED